MTPAERIREQLQHWRQDLINLSRTNRLLYFKATKSTLEILEPAATELLRGLAGAGLPIFEPPDNSADHFPDAETNSDEPPRELRAREILSNASDRSQLLAALRNLERRTTQEFMDKGLWVLYLGIGMLEWVNVEGDEHERVQSPLLLVPVALKHDNPQRPYQLREADEEVAINPALAAKLEHDFGLSLPGIEDVEDLEPRKLFESVRELVHDHSDWRVTPQVVLGTFSFHKEVMYRDLLVNEEAIAEHPLVRALAMKPEECDVDLSFEPVSDDQLDEKAPPEQMSTILDADASQRKCIVAAREGRSFVMDGPPGTGKSQTIANVIAELLASGQTVLFVSEKAAALEVVHARLQAAGIHEFALQLHSHKTTRREVARELGRALTQRPRALRPLEPVRLERLIARRRELSLYALAVNEVRSPLGQSLHQVLGRIAQLQSLPQGPHPELAGSSLDAATLLHLLEGARALSRAWDTVERGDSFLWRDLANPNLDAARARTLTETVAAAEDTLNALQDRVSALAREVYPPWRSCPADAERFVTLLQHLELRPTLHYPVPSCWLSEPDLDGVERRAQELQQSARRAGTLMSKLGSIAGPRWAELGGEADANAIEQAATKWDQLVPDLAFDQQWRQSDVGARAAFLAASVSQLQLAAGRAIRVASAFGLQEADCSLARMRELTELGELAGSATPPEASWLDTPSLATAEEATKVLEEHVTEYLRHRRALTEVFAESVLDLDLQGLCVRFETVHRGWRKLLPAYWRDCRTVAACARSGRATKDVLARLRGALAWRKCKERLSAAEARHARFLGRYYRRDRTDFRALKASLAQTKRALDLVGAQVDRVALQRQLTRQEGVDHGVVPLARELIALVDAWLREARGWLGDRVVDELSRRPSGEATTLCERASSLLQTVFAVVARAATSTGNDLSIQTVRECSLLNKQVTKIREAIQAAYQRDSAVLGSGYAGLDTSWEELLETLAWARRLRDILGGDPAKTLDQALIDTLLRINTSPRETAALVDRWRGLRDALGAEFRDTYRQRILDQLESEFTTGRSLLVGLRNSVNDITTWEAFARAHEALEAAGLATTAQFCIEHKVQAANVPGVLERAILEKWADEVIRSDSRLKHVRPEDRDDFVRDFQELDREFIRVAAGRVIETCNAKRPMTTAGAAGVILYEAQKQKKHMPVPKLLTATHAVVQAIKPCFMMSPLTVSQFVPPSMRFDAVIFDEASQVRPSDAINCIYRGHRLIVAGDQKQLPPTTFFESVTLDGDDEWEEEEIPDFESVLDLCQAHGFPSLTLRWHYRSQHEDLITFSNYSFYDGRLLTFPGAQESGQDLGVEFFEVAGIYRRGGARDNPVEAKKVVERVLFHAVRHPRLSLGVVSFSEAQATAIQDALEMERSSRPELRRLLDNEDRLRGFFVKNLETVQGDERDILIFSIGYGRDENGKFTMQFGPVNRRGGERRLNVAVTRARRRVEVVCSVSPDEFVGDPGSDGVRHLKRYLDYARRSEHKVRALAFDVSTSGHDVESPFEEEVARVVRAWGYDVVAQVGCAGYRVDLAVRHPGRPGVFALGIECDGAAYHSSRVARDRDRLRQEILKGLDWRLHRIWGPSWYRNRGEQEVKLRRAIEAALVAPLPPRDPVSPPTARPVEVDAVDLDDAPKWSVPYAVASPGSPRAGLQMHEHSVDLVRMIEEVVRVEGPAHQDLVLRRVREQWGVQRAGSRIRSAFDWATQLLCRRTSIVKDSGFLSIKGSRLEKVRRSTDDPRSCRGVEEVPTVELELAVRMLVRDAHTITWDELTMRVAKLFGWNRRGPDIAKALESVIQSHIRGGALVADGNVLTVGKQSS